MIPRIIHQFWDRPNPPPGIAHYIDVWRIRHPGWTHILWNDETAADFIRSEFGGDAERSFRACRLPTMRSDILRTATAIVLGGVYADADGRCRAPIEPLLPAPPQVGTLSSSVTKPGRLMTGFFIMPPRNFFMERVLERVLRNVRLPNPVSVSATTGPGAFQAVWRELSPEDRRLFKVVDWHALRPFVKFKLHTNEIPPEEHWSVRMHTMAIVEFPEDEAMRARDAKARLVALSHTDTGEE